MRTAETNPVLGDEAKSLFSGLEQFSALMLAVSGGPDSTALMLLAARWRKTLKIKPKLIALTVDHGLRAESKREAASVARLARKLGIAHRTLHWRGAKPKTGLQEAARVARYRLLADAARKAKASHLLTAHTRDDQAETVLIRMSRGSGLAGLAAMARVAPVPGDGAGQLRLVRPLLGLAKARLVATLRAAKISFADDPSNRDPRFTRARLRGLMGGLAGEGLDSRRLALLAQRLKRADQAIDAVVDRAVAELAGLSPAGDAIAIDAVAYSGLPAEIALRLIGRAVNRMGDEGPAELAKLEALKSALDSAQMAGNRRFRRSLAGAMVTLAGDRLTIERAPPRRRKSRHAIGGPSADAKSTRQL
ncbi:MAG TPA: tRNA lysidine(34) synthetase TilS [Pseudolabrys sp.]|nr:tRNA lysidine(34) synthetase TilS [Pseudolabrys sp.]